MIREDLGYAVPEGFYGLDFANSNVVVPRRLRVPGPVDRRLVGPIDFHTDPRVHYWYHADDDASVTAWVSGGRASGWNDDGPKGWHLNSYGSPLGQKPYYYTSVSYFNNKPALYSPSWYNADTSQIQYHALSRDDPYMHYINNGSSGSGTSGWYFGMVFCTESFSGGGTFYKSCCEYPAVRPWRTGLSYGPEITVDAPPYYVFDDEQAYIFSEHLQLGKGAQRLLVLKQQGQPVTIKSLWYMNNNYDMPYLPGDSDASVVPTAGQALGVTGSMLGYGSWTVNFYWAEALLMFGNISLQEVNWIETNWASKYGITLEKQ